MPRIDLDSDLLRCFVAVADARGFTAAGDLIGLTQSGISVRIRNLEERLGRRLFERTSRSVSLTEDGEVLLSYARRMVDLNDEAIGRLTGAQTQGRLRVGLADYVKPSLMPQLLGRFNRLHPGVTMEMRTGLSMDLLPGYEQGELDVVIAGRGMVFKDGGLLYRDALVWVAAPGFPAAPRPAGPARNPAAALHPPRHQPGGIGSRRHPLALRLCQLVDRRPAGGGAGRARHRHGAEVGGHSRAAHPRRGAGAAAAAGFRDRDLRPRQGADSELPRFRRVHDRGAEEGLAADTNCQRAVLASGSA